MDRIVIAGGGFGGLYTALQLQKFPWQPQVTLIDLGERFLFTPLLYELVSHELELWEIAPRFSEILQGTGVNFIQGQVVQVNPEGKTLQLADGQEIPFDQLVLACGGRTPLDIVPGATELALPFRTLNHADQLNQYLRTWEAEGRQDLRLSLVGAGASGVELACKLADRLGDRARLTLIERGSEILREGTPDLRRLAEAALRKREVTVLLQTTVEKIEPGQIFLQPARPLAADLVLWTVGTVATVQPLAAKTDRLGRLMTRPTLQLLDYPEIFALGDGAVGPLPVPVTAQAAIQQADYCAWNLWANRTKLPLLDFQYLPLGQLVSLGIGDAAADLLGVTLDGPVAAQMRRLVYLARMPGLQQQVQVGLNWLSQPIREALAAGGFN